MTQIQSRVPDAVQRERHKRVYARLRRAMARNGAPLIRDPRIKHGVPGLQRTAALRFALRCARDTYFYSAKLDLMSGKEFDGECNG